MERIINSQNRGFHYLIIVIVCFFAFIVNNQVIPADLMESRNLATAQEMVRNNNYLIPTMNGELRLEKPPLPTWIAAAVENLIPGNLVAQRCAVGIIATIMALFLYLFVSRLTGNCDIGLMASLVMATCFNIVLMGRTATWDIYCHSFMLGAIFFLFQAFGKKGAQWKYFIAAGVFMGLSFLGKGPVSFYALLFPFIIAYIWVYRPSIKEKGAPLAVMIGVCLVISFWWMIYVLIFHSDMAFSIAHKESSSWINHNVRPWYYYWQFPAEAGIWALFLVTALLYFFLYKKHEYRKQFRFSVIWFFASLILLSVIPEKKTRYLLPILIPASICIAHYFYYCIKNMSTKGERLIFRINACVIAIIIFAVPIALYIIFFKENLVSIPILILTLIAGWGLSIYILTAALNKYRIKVTGIFGAVILCMIMVEGICLIPVGKLFINQEIHSIRMLREYKHIQNLPFYYNSNEHLRMELVYEANQTIKPMDIENDSLILKNTPFVFISGLSVDSLFRDKNVSVEIIDTFDNNWIKPGSKRYNKDLVRQAAIIKAKQDYE